MSARPAPMPERRRSERRAERHRHDRGADGAQRRAVLPAAEREERRGEAGPNQQQRRQLPAAGRGEERQEAEAAGQRARDRAGGVPRVRLADVAPDALVAVAE
jgi:hypothetical protein